MKTFKPCKVVWATLAALILSGCGSTKVTTTAYTPLEQPQTIVPESQLLDVGVIPLNPGLDEAGDNPVLLPELRNAESRFLANKLSATIQQSAAWGAVRVVPNTETIMDVYVQGTILHSDGETLKLEITPSDTKGRTWYTKTYTEVVGKYAYERREQGRDPFQGLFNRIANDLMEYRHQNIASAEAEELRTVSELRFAHTFSPEAYDEHIVEDPEKGLSIARLPADNDPLMQRIRRIRERDYLFVDTLQEHYHTFSKRMERPYQEWRAMSYDEIVAVRKLKRDSISRTVAGVGAILVGIAAAGSDGGSTQAAGMVAIGSGGLLIKSGLSKRQEARIHIDALTELGSSLEAEIEPQVIELEDRTITLTGSVDAQYEQWKDILKQIYEQERGEI